MSSEFDPRSGRKGFVRDVMRRISAAPPEGDPVEPGDGDPARSPRDEVEDLRNALRLFGADSPEFRRRLDRVLAEHEAMRRRYHLTREQFADAERQNERLVGVLQEAKQQIELLKEEVDKLCAPPNNYGIFTRANKDGTAEIFVDGRQMRVNVHPNVDPFQFVEGQQVVLNEAFNIVEPAGFIARGEIASVVDFLADNRVIALGHTDDERVITLSDPLRRESLKVGDHILYDPRTHYAFEKMPKSAVEEVVLEEIPEVTYDDIGGLGDQIGILRDSVELPYIYPEVFAEHKLSPPKGILLYGPPCCGKTLIAKAVANSLAKSIEKRTGKETTPYFLNVKGPELLNKYVGETEHKLREVFKKARDKGVLVGLSAHNPALIALAEEKGWDVDYYMCCLYYLTRPREEFQKLLGGQSPLGEIYLQDDPPRMFKVIQAARKPCLAYKLLAAGRQVESAAQVRRCFETAFKNIKPTDAVIVNPREVLTQDRGGKFIRR